VELPNGGVSSAVSTGPVGAGSGRTVHEPVSGPVGCGSAGRPNPSRPSTAESAITVAGGASTTIGRTSSDSGSVTRAVMPVTGDGRSSTRTPVSLASWPTTKWPR
jgi:hypothetical protein